MYAKWIEIVCKTYSTFGQTFIYILYIKLKEQWQLNFIYKMFTDICWDVGYILYIFCIHFAYINSDLQKVCKIIIMYIIFIQNSYRIYIQIIVCKMDNLFQQYFDPFIVHFLVDHCMQLKIENQWLCTLR